MGRDFLKVALIFAADALGNGGIPMTGVLNISSATLGQVLLNTSVRPLALAHYQDAIGGGRLHLIQVSGHPCVSTGFGGVAEG